MNVVLYDGLPSIETMNHGESVNGGVFPKIAAEVPVHYEYSLL
jgi:hypothetical protein